MKNNRSKIKIVLIPLFILIGLLLPIWMEDQYLLHILINIFIWSILTLGVRIILVAGHLNAAQASFMGMGAYMSALMAMKLGWSFWLCMPLAGLFTAALALCIGFPTLRIKGAYFVMVTFAVTEVFRHIWMMWKTLFGGPQGLLGIPRPDPIHIAGLTIAFTTKVPFYYLALILLLITLLVTRRVDMSRFGMTLRAIPQADQLAESVGVNVMKYKVIAFVIGSFFAGIAGSFWAHYFTYASPWDFTWMNSLYMLMYAVIGGTGSVLGPIVGCFILLSLDEILRPLKEYVPIILGAILIVVLLFLPGGLITVPERIRSLFQRRRT
jgi:branched-chain amino acid transport system permease protein